eukprot:TRINITY_DN979_c0_g1_i1.p1 TRINITY_DN979_c0_g1~~TRINITY_DN979_c0_g1_i1.p1  ORF type:complete len:207 (+),score=51.78 TRINITY_DN979_c0_g1_i1:94-714(+)
MPAVISKDAQRMWIQQLADLAFSLRPDLRASGCRFAATDKGIVVYDPSKGVFLFFDGGRDSKHPMHFHWIHLSPFVRGIPLGRLGAAVCAYPPRHELEKGRFFVHGGFDVKTGTVHGDLHMVKLIVSDHDVRAVCELLHADLGARFGHALIRDPVRDTFKGVRGYDRLGNPVATDWIWCAALRPMVQSDGANVRFDALTDFSGFYS